MILKHLLAVLIVACLPLSAIAQNVPTPRHGVSFEEWAAASARLANNEDKEKVLKVLEIDDKTFDDLNTYYGEALKNDKDFKLITLYGELFSNPNSGRFATGAEQIGKERILKTFEDYARVQGHLEASTAAKIDPQEVLKEHGLTVYQYSQDSAYWVGKMREQGMAGDTDGILKWNATLARFKAEYAARYAKK